MLILSRKKQESVVVGGAGGAVSLLKVTVLEIARGKVKLGFEAGDDVPVHRLEIWERMCATGELHGLRGDLESPPARAG